MVTGPNLEEYCERLRGFAIGSGNEDAVMQGVFSMGKQRSSNDITDLYDIIPTFPAPLIQVQTETYPDTMEDSGFSTLGPFVTIPEPGYHTAHGASQVMSPFDLGSIQTSSSNDSAPAMRQSSDEFTFDEVDFEFDNWDDLFGEMPQMPGLDGVIDQGFLDFLDTHQ